jgi:pimeloyl-ACP methyl ester carboxylesterase
MWDGQADAWRDRHRIVRYDTRGWGRTKCEPGPWSDRADLLAVMDQLSIERAHLVGLSRGGGIALDFTVEQPSRVRSLTWVAGGIRGHSVEDSSLDDIWQEMERLEEANQIEPLVELETQLWTDGPRQSRDRVDPGVRRRMVEWNLESYRADQPGDTPIEPDLVTADLLAGIRVPVFAIWGTLDEPRVPIAGEKLAAEVPGARRHVFEGVAHMVNLERPDEFNSLVGDFIDEVDAREDSA